MKTLAAIFAMILVNTTLSWGQNIDAYYSSLFLVETKAKLDSLYGKFERIDLYAGKSSVDDGFGGTWNVEDVQDDKDYAPDYILRRPSNRFSQKGIIDVSGDWNKLPLYSESGPIVPGMNVAFHGYIKGLVKMGGKISVVVWIDPNTGIIDEVAFMFQAYHRHGVNMGAAIPPRNYALFEDILKKTVFFDVKNIDFTERNIESNYCYSFKIPFRDVSGLNHSPDFLEGHYPPNYKYL